MDGECGMSGIGLHTLSFTIKHPLKKKYMKQPRKSGSLNMPALQHSVKPVISPAADRYYLPSDRFFGYTAGEIPGSLY